MNALIGYTGFVGSNLYNKNKFDKVYNSKNIKEAYGLKPDVLYYAGLRAEKYLANNEPEKDYELILEAEKNIKEINPRKIILISTVDVYKNPIDVNENTIIDTENLHPYGLNRYILETWVKENINDYIIVRLPGLYGNNIKKNFIYDYINVIPFMIKKEKMEEIEEINNEIIKHYTPNDNGFYKLNQIEDINIKNELKNIFKSIHFTALNFTDSRSKFQFYNLNRLYDDINILIKNNIKLFVPATEPISAGELYKYLTNEKFINEISEKPVSYDIKTVYSKLFSDDKNDTGYILKKDEVLADIKNYILNYGVK